MCTTHMVDPIENIAAPQQQSDHEFVCFFACLRVENEWREGEMEGAIQGTVYGKQTIAGRCEEGRGHRPRSVLKVTRSRRRTCYV